MTIFALGGCAQFERSESTPSFTPIPISNVIGPGDASQIALLQSPAAQAALANAQITHARRMQQLDLPNPSVAFSDLSLRGDAAESNVARSFEVHLPILALLARLTSPLSRQQLKQAHVADIAAVMFEQGLAAEADWYQHRANLSWRGVRRQRVDVARLQAELAERFFSAGNIKEAELREYQVAYALQKIQANDLQARVLQSRLALKVRLGAPLDQALKLKKLPRYETWQIPAAHKLIDLMRTHQQKLDAAQIAQTAAGDLARRGNFLSELLDLHVGREQERETGTVGDERFAGSSIELQLPLFNWGGNQALARRARLAKANAERVTIEQRLHADVIRLRELIQLKSDSILELQNTALPAANRIWELGQSEQQAMLISLFELLEQRDRAYRLEEKLILLRRDEALLRLGLLHAMGAPVPVSSSTPSTQVEARRW